MKYNPNIVAAFFLSIGLPKPEFEYRFHPDRKWRFDICFVEQKLAVEVQGGLFVYGGHNRGAQMLKEYEKLNTAASMGWRVLFVIPQQLCVADTAALIKKSLAIFRYEPFPKPIH